MTRVLCIGAHNDEIMADMGGTAFLLRNAGCETLFLNLACQWNDNALPEETKSEYRRQELASANELGGRFMCIGNRDDLLFLESKQIIEETCKVILDYRPNIVFIHFPNDYHTEHREVASVSIKALSVAHVRGARIQEIYTYDTGASQSANFFNPDFAIHIGRDGMDAIQRSLMHYDQNHANGPYMVKANEIRKKYRGSQFGVDYAEVFKFVKFPDGSDDILLKKLMGDAFRWKGSGQYPAFAEMFF